VNSTSNVKSLTVTSYVYMNINSGCLYSTR
jgi:hypothetical protein